MPDQNLVALPTSAPVSERAVVAFAPEPTAPSAAIEVGEAPEPGSPTDTDSANAQTAQAAQMAAAFEHLGAIVAMAADSMNQKTAAELKIAELSHEAKPADRAHEQETLTKRLAQDATVMVAKETTIRDKEKTVRIQMFLASGLSVLVLCFLGYALYLGHEALVLDVFKAVGVLFVTGLGGWLGLQKSKGKDEESHK